MFRRRRRNHGGRQSWRVRGWRKDIGLNIGLPHEQRPNPWVTRELSFEFRYFFMRKLWFAHLARAVVVFPGGFGTLDELAEFLTLEQTRKLDRRVQILLFGSSYWKEIINFNALIRHGMISPEDVTLFQYVDDPVAGASRSPKRIGRGLEPRDARLRRLSWPRRLTVDLRESSSRVSRGPRGAHGGSVAPSEVPPEFLRVRSARRGRWPRRASFPSTARTQS